MGFRQSLAHFEYAWFVFNLLSHYCERYPYSYSSTRKGAINYNITITTRALPCFTEFHPIFYVNNKKRVPHNIYELLTPVALAHLIMGDGAVMKGKGLRICTDSFDIKDLVLLLNVLIIKYGFICTVHEDRTRFRLYISKSSMGSLLSVLRPHMTPGMLYKLGI